MAAFRVDEFKDSLTTGFQEIISFSCGLPVVSNLKIADHIKRLLEYTVQGGKHLRSCLTLSIASEYCRALGTSLNLSSSTIISMTIELVCTAHHTSPNNSLSSTQVCSFPMILWTQALPEEVSLVGIS